MKEICEKGRLRVTEGARLLRAYLKANRISVPKFCEDHGLDRIQVQRVLNGERWQRISVNFAMDIRKATGGRISLDKWNADTARDAVKAA